MEIGKPIRRITVEPAQEPVPEPIRREEPRKPVRRKEPAKPTRLPVKVPEKVPA